MRVRENAGRGKCGVRDWLNFSVRENTGFLTLWNTGRGTGVLATGKVVKMIFFSGALRVLEKIQVKIRFLKLFGCLKSIGRWFVVIKRNFGLINHWANSNTALDFELLFLTALRWFGSCKTINWYFERWRQCPVSVYRVLCPMSVYCLLVHQGKSPDVLVRVYSNWDSIVHDSPAFRIAHARQIVLNNHSLSRVGSILICWMKGAQSK